MSPPPPKSRADPYRPIKSSTLRTSLKFDDMLGAKPKSKSVAARLSRARHRWGRHSARAPFAAAARKLAEGVILVPKKKKSPPVKSSLPQQESPSEKGAPPTTPSQSSSQSSDNPTALTQDQWACDCMVQRLRELKEEVAPGTNSSHPTFEYPGPLEDTAPGSAAMKLVKARHDFTAKNHKRYLDYLWNKICSLEEKKQQASQPPEISSVEVGRKERDFCRPPHLHYSLLEVMTMRRIALKHAEIRSRCEARRKLEQAKQQAALRKSKKKKVAGESKQKPSKKTPASEPAPVPIPQRQPPTSATDPKATREAVALISGDRKQPEMLRIYEMFYKRGVLDKLTDDD